MIPEVDEWQTLQIQPHVTIKRVQAGGPQLEDLAEWMLWIQLLAAGNHFRSSVQLIL